MSAPFVVTGEGKMNVMKKEKIHRLVLTIIAVLACLGWQLMGEKNQKIPYVNDGSVSWDLVSQIEVYETGSAQPPSRVIQDSEEIELWIHALQQVKDYKKISKAEYREGMMNRWVRFDNGVVIGLYENENYGYIGTELDGIGTEPFYRFPESFYKLVFQME